MSGKLTDLRPKTGKLRPGKLRPGKLRPCFFFPGEIIKFQLSLPLSDKMNEMNALTPTNNNLVVFYKRNFFRLPQGGVFTVHFKVCEKKAKLSEAVPYILCKPVVSEKVLCDELSC